MHIKKEMLQPLHSHRPACCRPTFLLILSLSSYTLNINDMLYNHCKNCVSPRFKCVITSCHIDLILLRQTYNTPPPRPVGCHNI